METDGSKSEMSPATLDMFPVPMSNVSSDHKSVTWSSHGPLVNAMATLSSQIPALDTPSSLASGMAQQTYGFELRA